ncbi:MAG: peptidoglycan DD-metalloendopeptidase family protein [Candidatus Fimisoma sp.]|nr:M23 family metallopeptidase [Candidatus Fimisoma sp.]
MRQAQKKKEKDKVAIVLMLAFCIIALTSIFTVKANIDKVNKTKDVPVSENAGTEEPSDSGSQKSDAASQVSGKVPTVDSIDSEPAVSNFQFPVKHENAQVTNPYSMDKLIYSVTLDQYMTHCGVDIEAPEDAQVVAVADGTVTAVYEDDRYGTSIEITHPGDIVSVYSNLSTAEMVETGDVVSGGQIIGGVGSTGLFESLEPAHLHFEMLKGGAYVNPGDFIKF